MAFLLFTGLILCMSSLNVSFELVNATSTPAPIVGLNTTKTPIHVTEIVPSQTRSSHLPHIVSLVLFLALMVAGLFSCVTRLDCRRERVGTWQPLTSPALYVARDKENPRIWWGFRS